MLFGRGTCHTATVDGLRKSAGVAGMALLVLYPEVLQVVDRVLHGDDLLGVLV
jgi:hypothetical protein